jgi:macrodomain Ter protein organizer (MatP/YcbG family)
VKIVSARKKRSGPFSVLDRKKTSLTLDRDLWRRLRIYAAETDQNLGDVVDAALRKWVEVRADQAKDERLEIVT